MPGARFLKSTAALLAVSFIAALIVFGWLAEHVMAGGPIPFDAPIRHAAHEFSSPALTLVMRILSVLGGPFLVLMGILLLAEFLSDGRRRTALLFLVTMLGAVVLEETLKFVFHRPRPMPFFGPPVTSYSFPSGHALLSLCFYGSLAAIVSMREPRRHARFLPWVSALLLAAAIGWSRIYLGVHYPSDVLAGYAGAVIWVVAVISADHFIRRYRARQSLNTA